MLALSLMDQIALGWFWACWIGYTILADYSRLHRRTVAAAMDEHRKRWLRAMLLRDNRMLDIQIIGNLIRGNNFFAQTSIFAIGGTLAAFGALDQLIALVTDVPFADHGTRTTWEIKILLLTLIFVYAFFKFGWAFRLFNNSSVLIGTVPPPPCDANATADADRAARVVCRAAHHSNRGLRAYFFALAALAWLFHPVAFIAAATWVLLVNYRREFRSHTLNAITDDFDHAEG